MDQKALEAAARAVDRQLAFEVESDVRAHELTRDEQTSVAQAAITVYLAQREADGFVEFPISIIEDLCSELEAEVQDRWGYDERLARQLDRDMETVNKARAMIAARPRGEG
jgi:hypothetical protein